MAELSGFAPRSGIRLPRLQNQRLWRSILVPTVLILVWWVAAWLNLASSRLLVSPQEVIGAAFFDPQGSMIWSATLQSLSRMAVGFSIGAALGLVVGLSTGMATLLDRTVSPTLNALRQITLFAWIPLLTGWFGNGETTRLVYIAISVFFPIAFSVHNGLTNVPVRYLEVADVLGLSRRRRIFALLLPAALPSACIGLQVGLLTGWLGTISAEYVIGISNGIGSLIVVGREQFRMEIVLLGVLTLALVGFALTAASNRMRRLLLRNHGTVR